jgi:hypothetical protein
MKKLFLGLVLAAVASLAIALPASAAEFETFVGCDDLAETPVPAHICQIGDFPGAYFESDVDAEYEVCIEFPDAVELCAEEQFAEAGVLYVNSITSNLEGEHLVTWYVEGVEVGSWTFRLDPPPPPPPPPPAQPLPTPAATPPPAVAPVTSAGCLKAQQRVGSLKNRLRNASGRKRKAKLRIKLRSARVTARHVC